MSAMTGDNGGGGIIDPRLHKVAKYLGLDRVKAQFYMLTVNISVPAKSRIMYSRTFTKRHKF